MTDAVVVLAVGNRFAGDDGAAFAVLDAARADLPDDVAVRELDGEPSRILDAWEGFRSAVVIDATRSGSPVGTVHRFTLGRAEARADVAGPGPHVIGITLPRQSSSHGAGVGEALALGAALGRRPDEVVIVGIEGVHFGPGDGLSHDVVHAIPGAVGTVLAEVARLREVAA